MLNQLQPLLLDYLLLKEEEWVRPDVRTNNHRLNYRKSIYWP